MSELELREERQLADAAGWATTTKQLILPGSGELIELGDPVQVAHALHRVREHLRQVGALRALLETLLRIEARRHGTKTLHLGQLTAEVTGGSETVYERPQQLRAELEAAGLPADELQEAVTATVVYEPKHARLKRLAAGNPAYEEIIARYRRTEPRPWRVRTR